MYNEELKQRFIQNYTTSLATAKVCEDTFKSTEKYEIQWEADLCTKTEEELSPLVESIVSFMAHNKSTRLIILKDYVKWCIANNVPGACDGMIRFVPSGMEKMRARTVSSPVHMQKYLDSVFDPEQRHTIDNVYRCYFWLAYMGLDEEDSVSVKAEDVVFSTMSVRVNDTEYPIYRESIQTFKNCVELDAFVYEHPGYTKEVWKPRAAGTKLLRVTSPDTPITYIRSCASRIVCNAEKRGVEIRMSYFRSWVSGTFYRMYQDEQAGVRVNFDSIAMEQMRGKEYKLDSGRNTIRAKMKQISRSYFNDYELWKLAYKM